MKSVALVVGGNGGIGSCAVAALLERGVEVYATYREDSGKIRELRETLFQKLIRCDVRNPNDVKNVIAQIKDREDRLDILVYSVAAPLKLKPLDRMTEAEIDEDIDVGLRGAIRFCAAALPLMKTNRSGVIIFLLSESANRTSPRMSVYSAAKAALAAFTRNLASEVSNWNIRIVGISPSFVETALIRAFPAKLLELERQKASGNRLLQPRDIAALIADAAQNPARYPNGSIVTPSNSEDPAL